MMKDLVHIIVEDPGHSLEWSEVSLLLTVLDQSINYLYSALIVSTSVYDNDPSNPPLFESLSLSERSFRGRVRHYLDLNIIA